MKSLKEFLTEATDYHIYTITTQDYKDIIVNPGAVTIIGDVLCNYYKPHTLFESCNISKKIVYHTANHIYEPPKIRYDKSRNKRYVFIKN